MTLDDLNKSKKSARFAKKSRRTGKFKNITKVKKSKRTKSSKKRGRDPVGMVLNGLLVVFGIGLFGVIASIGQYGSEVKRSENIFRAIKPLSVQAKEESNVITCVDIEGVKVWERYVEQYLQNNDLIGWITIEDTKIDYPVMYTPESNNTYLHAGFDKSYSASGTIFADMNADMGTLSDNVILYGHHMKSGTMFAGLEKYEDQKYANAHKTVIFDTINGRQEYEVVSAFRISTDEEFKYYEFFKAKSVDEYREYISEIMERSYLEKVEVEDGAKLLTLSTCDYTKTNGRFVVVCKQIKNMDDYDRNVVSLTQYQSIKDGDVE